MDWTEICLTVATAQLDAAAAIANMTVPYGMYIEDYSDLEQGAMDIAHIDLIDGALLEKERDTAKIHLYISPAEAPAEALAFLRERLSAAGIAHTLADRAVREEDWANNWKAYFKPLPIGKQLLICPSWEQPGEAAAGRHILKIDPGMAFGTGGHDTTRLVLEALERQIRPGDAMLDIGCGSGVLSIAGCLLGAGAVLGVDIDALAVKTARENGAMNGLFPPRYSMTQGNLTDRVSGEFDVITANIVADAIIALSPDARRFLRAGGVYIVSGIIDTREQDVLSALAAAGFTVCERHARKGWLCFVCRAA